ncbi:MAG TPA: bL34 family ribosomal protein [Patescibacteria group bacterium]|nr:bL34 family ribosomal protein [Patescibacteria group bacterium]
MTELLTKHKKLKGTRKHGFLSRLKSRSGKQVIKRRRLKGRAKI